MKFSFTCPAPDCGAVMSVEADSQEEAVDKIMSMGADHQKEVHPDMPPQTPEEATAMVQGGMKKVDSPN